MPKNLVIVESPAKSKTLARFLGKDYDVVSTVGHIIDLPKSKIGVDIENDFEPEYKVIKGKEKVIAELKKAAKKADTIFLAPDPDREGEAIAWHVANTLKPKTSKNGPDMLRVTFNEITATAVREAIKHPRPIDQNLVNAQQARRVLDRLVGYKVSPFLWKTIARNLSAGRVQSVALRLVCEREEEIKAFTPEEYWQIKTILANHDDTQFEASLYKINGATVVKAGDAGKNKIVIGSQKDADKIVADLKKAAPSVIEIKHTERQRRPLPPFITSTMQQEAAKAFGFSPKQTMSTAQKLYEGVELGKRGATGLITYMRTDSTRISNEALTAARSFINDAYGDEYLPPKAIRYSSKKQAQDAHEAIRPTYMDLPPEKVKRYLTTQQLKLYTLIWQRFVASQMKPAVYAVETVDIEAGKYTLRASAQKLIFDGFLKVYHEAKDPDENGNGNGVADTLPDLDENEKLKVVEVNPSQSFTKPPPRYSEASLVKRLEADGIGRPSTYASIISVIKDRKYVELTDRRLHPTDLGFAVNRILVENFPRIFNVEFTAEMERELDLVEEGTDDWVKVLGDFYEPFSSTLASLKDREKEIKASMTEETDIKCDKCGGMMVIKWGRNGRFLGCENYPECRNTRPLPEEEAASKTDKKCDICGSPMVIKTGRFGRFLACSAYPECKNTKPLTLGIKCPRPGCDGEITERQTRGRRTFYGCTNYPKCNFASWDKPVNKQCPTCGNPYMVEKVTKASGEYLQCPECKSKVKEEDSEQSSPAEHSQK